MFNLAFSLIGFIADVALSTAIELEERMVNGKRRIRVVNLHYFRNFLSIPMDIFYDRTTSHYILLINQLELVTQRNKIFNALKM